MNKVGVWVLVLLCSTALGQSAAETAEIKAAALETVRAIQDLSPGPIVTHWPKGKKCQVSRQNLYAGEPFLVHSLIHPTEGDLTRLRHRIETAQQKNPDFIANARGEVRAARLIYQDYYEVPIYHRTCGYMFHVQPGDEKGGELSWGPFKPISAQKAQMLLGVAEPPTFAYVQSLSFLRDGYMWISGSRAVNAFFPAERYRIVDRAGKPVSPVETRLTPTIFRESFVTSMSDLSAYWHLLLPVRLEPLEPSN